MCCLFGMLDYGGNISGREKSKILSVFAKECEARGTDATGIAYNYRNNLAIYKRPVAGRHLKMRIPNGVTAVMGHTRLTTQGDESRNQNNHPFRGVISGHPFALAHNGVLYNDKILQHTEKLPVTNIETDSYVAVQLIEKQESLSFDSLKNMAEQVEGSFVFTVLDRQGNLYFVKGDNPLCLCHFPEYGFYLYASTEAILVSALKKLGIPLAQGKKIAADSGDILCIDRSGSITKSEFDDFKIYQSYSLRNSRWLDCEPSYTDVTADDAYEAYLEELKSVASCYGYDSDDIDQLLIDGFTFEDIEEALYCHCGEV